MHLIKILERKYNADEWWPMERRFRPAEWEVCMGSILTQNTSWKNVEKSLDNLEDAGITSAKKTASCSLRKLSECIRPSGFFNAKAACSKQLASFVMSFRSFRDFQKHATREQLLGLKGIGHETADSLLLYACHRPFFVVDAYTRRIFSRLGYISGNEEYDTIRNKFERKLSSVEESKKLHGLIVEHAKHSCRKKPLCRKCILDPICLKSSIK